MKSRLVTLALVLQLAAAAWAADGTLTVRDPWIRPAPPNAPLAGYMTLENHSAARRTLMAASSREFGQVTIHRTQQVDGVVTMKDLAGIGIAAHGKLVFEPGAHHLMFEQPKRPLRAGDSVSVVLRFSDGSAVPVTFRVREPDAMADHGHASHRAILGEVIQ